MKLHLFSADINIMCITFTPIVLVCHISELLLCSSHSNTHTETRVGRKCIPIKLNHMVKESSDLLAAETPAQTSLFIRPTNGFSHGVVLTSAERTKITKTLFCRNTIHGLNEARVYIKKKKKRHFFDQSLDTVGCEPFIKVALCGRQQSHCSSAVIKSEYTSHTWPLKHVLL